MTSLHRLKTVLNLRRGFLNPPTTQFHRLSSKCEVSHVPKPSGSSDIRSFVFVVKLAIGVYALYICSKSFYKHV